jgi:hypothetical protein
MVEQLPLLLVGLRRPVPPQRVELATVRERLAGHGAVTLSLAPLEADNAIEILNVIAFLVRLAVDAGDKAIDQEALARCAGIAKTDPVPRMAAMLNHCWGLSDGDPASVRAAAEVFRKTRE